MTDTWSEAEADRFFAPGDDDTPPRDDDQPHTDNDYEAVFGAPDYASWVKVERTQRAREYEKKTNSVLKALTLAAFRNGQLADGATLVHHGPNFSRTLGDLTDVSDNAAKMIDVLTAPDNPWIIFTVTALPFALQFLRNHEREAQNVQKTWKQARAERKRAKREGTLPPREGTPITVKGPFGRKFTFHVHFPRPSAFLLAFKAQTREPVDLAREVLSDEGLRRALDKHGIKIVIRQDTRGGARDDRF
jgi:hypothetical protein